MPRGIERATTAHMKEVPVVKASEGLEGKELPFGIVLRKKFKCRVIPLHLKKLSEAFTRLR